MRLKSLIFSIIACTIYCCVGGGEPEGERLYRQHCANCHMEAGQGLRGLIPPLTDTKFITANRELMACWIKNGMSGPIQINGKSYDGEMPGVPYLTDAEIANIINYVQNEWHKGLEFYSEGEVARTLKECK